VCDVQRVTIDFFKRKQISKNLGRMKGVKRIVYIVEERHKTVIMRSIPGLFTAVLPGSSTGTRLAAARGI
tara:strand:+ start:236 stop:445 length:210 start_codon:yes stop_codon:yes gene_type:complete